MIPAPSDTRRGGCRRAPESWRRPGGGPSAVAPRSPCRRTVAFYALLGFRVGNSVTTPDGTVQWVWLQTERAALMFARADEAVLPETPAALMYLCIPTRWPTLTVDVS